MEAQFTIKGKKRYFKFWKKINEYSSKKMNSSTDKVVNISNVLFPTANTMIIKYELINLNEKYEIVMQGEYQNAFRYMKENGTISPDINIEQVVQDMHKQARLVSFAK